VIRRLGGGENMKKEGCSQTLSDGTRRGCRRSVGVILTFSVITLFLSLFITSQGSCDVVPGDVIDQTNWEKVEGLVQEEVLRFVKEGALILHIEALNYDPGKHLPSYALEARKTNAGKYDLDEDDWIIEAETGRRTERILGHPFPVIDPADPRAGTKIMYNTKYWQFVQGSLRGPLVQAYLSPRDYLRGVAAFNVNLYMDGNPEAIARPNPDRVMKYQITSATSPYDIAGTAVLTWRYRDPRVEDNSFAYVPAIRRVRRMTPANRSDGMMGSDMAVDDAGMYDGKVTAMTWKFLGKEERLVAFMGKDPERIVRNEDGEWSSTEYVTEIDFGYEKEGWQGAPWAPLNFIWAKRPVYVVEVTPKDPYYNYGTQLIWVDTENWCPVHKTINDRAGKFWKFTFHAGMNFEDKDKTMKIQSAGNQIVVDQRNKRSTVSLPATSTDIWTYYAKTPRDTFTLGGFQRFCK
jgi:hypothetical protein